MTGSREAAPRGFHKIRHYGLSSASHVGLGTLERAKETLGATGASTNRTATPTPKTYAECMLALTGVDVLRCPLCRDGRLVRVGLDFFGTPVYQDTS